MNLVSTIIVSILIGFFLKVFDKEITKLGEKVRENLYKTFMVVGMCAVLFNIFL